MPDWRADVRARMAGLTLAPAREAEIVDELSAHLDDRYEELIAGGHTPDEARRLALSDLDIGQLLAARLRVVERPAEQDPVVPGGGRGTSWSSFSSWWQDVRYGARMLRRSAGSASVAVLTLALGIGANVAIFQLLDSVTLRALPVKDPQALAEVRIAERQRATGNFTGRRPQLTFAQWQQIQLHQHVFDGVFAWGTNRFDLSNGGEAHYAQGLWVSGDFFRTLGVTPVLGRMLTTADDQPGCGSPGAVLSHAFWQRQFGGDTSIVGKTLTLDRHPFEIVGVAPAAFFGVEVGWRFDVAVPICAEPIVRGQYSALTQRHYWWLAAMGRLKAGVSLEAATAQLQAISAAAFQETLPSSYAPEDAKRYLAYRLGAFATPTGVSGLRRTYEQPLWLLMAITGLVLVIACANLANLLLARASIREREVAVRLALGASRRRLIRQLFIESLLLAGVGAILAVIVAKGLSRVLVAFLDTNGNPLFVDLATDWRVVAFTGGLGLLACLLFGLAPAFRATATTPGAVMKAQGRGLTASRERSGLRRALVISQVALSLVLVVGAVLFVRTFQNLTAIDAGFRPGGVLIADVDFGPLAAPAANRAAVHRDTLERIRALSGVSAAAEAAIVPVTGSVWNERVQLRAGDKPLGLTNVNRVTDGFLKTMGTRLLSGRDFTARDTLTSPPVAIVSEAFRRAYFKDVDPIGLSFTFQGGPGEVIPRYEIIGVMQDTKYDDVRSAFEPLVYIDEAQATDVAQDVQIFARAAASTDDLTIAIKRAVAEINPALTIDFRSLVREVRESLMLERLMATLSGFFGILAALLATIGLYGVMSYSVARRRNEIGIRMALGADRGTVVRLVVREASVLLVIGLAVGSAIALGAGRAATSLLFGLTPHDPVAHLAAATGLALVGLAASYWPARRASRVDPMKALRDE